MPARIFESLDALRPLVGQEIAVSAWLDVPQAMIDAFASTTGDRQWIHVDAARARAEAPFGTTIAHGFLTLALISKLHGEALHINGVQRIINYGLNRVRFPAPVPAHSRIRTRSTLQAFTEIAGAVQLTWTVKVEIEGENKPAMVAEWVLRYFFNSGA
jgi:acyl dehydratase